MTAANEFDEFYKVNQLAAELANGIERVLQGKDRLACYIALGLVIGASEKIVDQPDLPALISLIQTVAEHKMERAQ